MRCSNYFVERFMCFILPLQPAFDEKHVHSPSGTSVCYSKANRPRANYRQIGFDCRAAVPAREPRHRHGMLDSKIRISTCTSIALSLL